MNPSLELAFDEIFRKLDEIEARWDQRFPETRALREDLRIGAPRQIDAEVVADNWGGEFEDPAHVMEERDYEPAASDAASPLPMKEQLVVGTAATEYTSDDPVAPACVKLAPTASAATSIPAMPASMETSPAVYEIQMREPWEPSPCVSSSLVVLFKQDPVQICDREFVVGDLSPPHLPRLHRLRRAPRRPPPLCWPRCSPSRLPRLRQTRPPPLRPPWLHRPPRAPPRRRGRPPRLLVRGHCPRLRARVRPPRPRAVHHHVCAHPRRRRGRARGILRDTASCPPRLSHHSGVPAPSLLPPRPHDVAMTSPIPTLPQEGSSLVLDAAWSKPGAHSVHAAKVFDEMSLCHQPLSSSMPRPVFTFQYAALPSTVVLHACTAVRGAALTAMGHQGLAIVHDTLALQAIELLTYGGDFPATCDYNLIDVVVVFGRSCDVVVERSRLFSWDRVQQQPRPPPYVQVVFGCGSADVCPLPWPSFTLGDCCSMSPTICWKPPWPSFRAFHEVIAGQWCFSLPMLPMWLPSTGWNSRCQCAVLVSDHAISIISSCVFDHGKYRWVIFSVMAMIWRSFRAYTSLDISQTNFAIVSIWFSSNHSDTHYSYMEWVVCITLTLLSCFSNMMVQYMQLHDDVFCRILWLDSYASGMYYNFRDYVWFKVIWQLLALVIPTYSVELKRGGLTWLDSHSLFHEFDISCWALPAEMRLISSMVLLLSIFGHSADMLVLDGPVTLIGILDWCRPPRCFLLLSSIWPVKRKPQLFGSNVVLNRDGSNNMNMLTFELHSISMQLIKYASVHFLPSQSSQARSVGSSVQIQ